MTLFNRRTLSRRRFHHDCGRLNAGLQLPSSQIDIGMLSELALQKIQRINCYVRVTLRDIEIDTLKLLLAKGGAAILFCVRSLARAFVQRAG